ncbi:hypothetical protein HELRODRAFT_166820 [Helobdella robusta]|uniref:Uncharacterized protein n=1 Tax=Helobdella robusta TaxID=6412 RepID=T1EYK4_HELRO|nr:hypothetical protein HELRODRAFT_166820 [Helobdella robusta]ESO11778.1 hypothetical protein HELRODRAFT_166820 [Helobdella robusta]
MAAISQTFNPIYPNGIQKCDQFRRKYKKTLQNLFQDQNIIQYNTSIHYRIQTTKLKIHNGFIPLHIACKKNRIAVVKLLISYNKDSLQAKTNTRKNRCRMHEILFTVRDVLKKQCHVGISFFQLNRICNWHKCINISIMQLLEHTMKVMERILEHKRSVVGKK